ncbi:hypothetical protein BJ165DRAFT_1524610 [Panaeolus papilionaceus]|nr:hypothetical protein BJ165DRAFT_1524610 [Panaeolus papilionaceus]
MSAKDGPQNIIESLFHRSRVLKKYPWESDLFAMHYGDINMLDNAQTLIVSVKTYGAALLKGQDVISKSLRCLFEVDDSTVDVSPPKPTLSDTVRMVSIICALRILDICYAHKFQHTSNLLARTTLTDFSPPAVFDKRLRGWGSVVKSFIRCIGKSSPAFPLPLASAKDDPLRYQYQTINALCSSMDAHRVYLNIQMAVTYLTYLLRQNFAENGALPDLEDDIVSDQDHPDHEPILSLKCSPLVFRLPLHVATLVSPIFLLCNFKLYQHAWDRKSLLHLSICLGNDKPPSIRSMESIIWNTLFQLARAEQTLPEAIPMLAGLLENLVGSIDDNDLAWFSCDRSRLNLLNPSINDSTSPVGQDLPQNSTHHNVSEQPDPRVDVVSVQHPSAAASPQIHSDGKQASTSNRYSPTLSQHNICLSAHDSSHSPTPPLTPRNVEPDASKGNSGTNTAKNGPRRSKRKKTISNENDTYLGDVNDTVKTYMSLKEYLAGLPAAKVWSRFGNMVPPTGVHPTLLANETVDESSLQVWPMSRGFFNVPRNNLNTVGVPKPFTHSFNFFKTEGEEYCIDIAFHDALTRDYLIKWEDTLKCHYVDLGHGRLRPPHLSDGASAIKMIDAAQITNPQYLLSSFTNKHLLFSGPLSHHCLFNREALNNLLPLGTIIDIEDLSDGGTKPALCHGTLMQLYLCSEDPNAKILQSAKLPIGIQHVDSHPLSSDAAAWSYTRGLFMCPLDALFPYAQTAWSQISLKGAVSWMNPGQNGFGSFLEVTAGGQLCIVASMKIDSSSSHLSPFLPNTPWFDPRSDFWAYEYVWLTPGMKLFLKPNTWRMTFSLENSIVQGGLFYSTSTMANSLQGLMQTFATSNSPSNVSYVVSRTLLWRLLMFYYAAFVLERFDTDDHAWDHLPDILTVNGCSSFIVVCLLGICLSVFDPATYQHKDTLAKVSRPEMKKSLSRFAYTHMRIFDCDCYIYVRGLAYHMLKWLFHHYDIADTRCGAPNNYLSLQDILETCGALLADVNIHLGRAEKLGVLDPSFRDADLFNTVVSKTFSVDGLPNTIATSYITHKKSGQDTKDMEPLDSRWKADLKETEDALAPFPKRQCVSLFDDGWSDWDSTHERGLASNCGAFISDEDNTDSDSSVDEPLSKRSRLS